MFSSGAAVRAQVATFIESALAECQAPGAERMYSQVMVKRDGSIGAYEIDYEPPHERPRQTALWPSFQCARAHATLQ